MKYISTRGKSGEKGFLEILLEGLATDGGLYVPKEYPEVTPTELDDLSSKTYLEFAEFIIQKFSDGEIPHDVIKDIVSKSYTRFEHKDILPCISITDNLHALELFHGPSLAFKDVALQTLGNLFEYALAENGQSINIVGATSGDTGSAAIEAVKNRQNININILYPNNRVSEVQRRQMTTIKANNVNSIAVNGSFDDCQDMVKAMFNDKDFRDKMNLSAVNSINWARIMAQVTYYAYTSMKFKDSGRKLIFSVPTGNFGNVFAGYVAKRMGFPIDKFIIATNKNDILYRLLETGEMKQEKVNPSISPSMDIQISSNFERLLFELMDRDGAALEQAMQDFRKDGSIKLGNDIYNDLKSSFISVRCDEEDTINTIKKYHAEYNYLCDPHTAVGLYAAEMMQDKNSDIIFLCTAHPAKFPDAIKQAVGMEPELPSFLSDLLKRDEHFTEMDNDIEQIKEFVSAGVK